MPDSFRTGVRVNEKQYYARAHAKILDLIETLRGESLNREQWHRLCNINPNDPKHIPYRDAVNRVLYELSQVNEKKLIVKEGSRFKVLDNELVPIDFRGKRGNRIDLLFPFGIHQYCFLYRKNIMVVYGSKDAGKTALLLNITRLNMNKHRIFYFSSEMVEDELAVRLSKADGMELDDWCFEPYERSYDFDAVIEPDEINIIDFLELGGDEAEYYKGVALIRRIYDRLNKGIAIIACQKNKDAELPKGGSGLLEKARLAVSLDPGTIKLTVAKNWADGIQHSPRGKSWSYQLVGGINIVNPQESFGDEI